MHAVLMTKVVADKTIYSYNLTFICFDRNSYCVIQLGRTSVTTLTKSCDSKDKVQQPHDFCVLTRIVILTKVLTPTKFVIFLAFPLVNIFGVATSSFFFCWTLITNDSSRFKNDLIGYIDGCSDSSFVIT